MMEFFTALRKLLKGEVRLDLDSGVMEYRGGRIVAAPASSLLALVSELRNLVGDSAVILVERLGYALGKSTRESMGWNTPKEALEGLREVAKFGGYGIVEIHGDVVEMKNAPVSNFIEDPVLQEYVARYLNGFFRGLCIEPLNVEFRVKEKSIRVKYRFEECR